MSVTFPWSSGPRAAMGKFPVLRRPSHPLPFASPCLVITRAGTGCYTVVLGSVGVGNLPQLQAVLPPLPFPFRLKVFVSL